MHGVCEKQSSGERGMTVRRMAMIVVVVVTVMGGTAGVGRSLGEIVGGKSARFDGRNSEYRDATLHSPFALLPLNGAYGLRGGRGRVFIMSGL